VHYLVDLGANIDAKDSFGNNALWHANDFGYADVVKYLSDAATIIDTTRTASRHNGHKFRLFLPFFKKKGNK
jgi:ankyrin repeat protein